MAGSSTKTMVVASNPQALAELRQQVVQAVRSHDFPDAAVFAIQLSLDEAFCNAIRHGNQGDPRKVVTVSYDVTDEAATISVTDQGPGFDPDGVPDPTLEENLTRPSGRGVMLMRQYMTDVKFSQGGRTVTMIKRRDCRKPL